MKAPGSPSSALTSTYFGSTRGRCASPPTCGRRGNRRRRGRGCFEASSLPRAPPRAPSRRGPSRGPCSRRWPGSRRGCFESSLLLVDEQGAFLVACRRGCRPRGRRARARVAGSSKSRRSTTVLALAGSGRRSRAHRPASPAGSRSPAGWMHDHRSALAVAGATGAAGVDHRPSRPLRRQLGLAKASMTPPAPEARQPAPAQIETQVRSFGTGSRPAARGCSA